MVVLFLFLVIGSSMPVIFLKPIGEGKKILTDIQNTVVSYSGKLFSFGMTVVVIGVLLLVFQQFVGINAVLYYAP